MIGLKVISTSNSSRGKNTFAAQQLCSYMTYYVYILHSFKLNRFYIGQTINLENRLVEHNSGGSQYSSAGTPWLLIWSTTKESYRQAEALEFKLKNLSRSRKIKFMQKYDEGLSNPDILESFKL